MEHFTWTDFFLPHSIHHVVYSLLCAGVLIGVGFLASKRLKTGNAHIPEGRFNIKAFFELFVEQLLELSDSIIGKKGRAMLPLFCFFFLFIFVQNLLGLIPGFLPPSQNINTTMALGVFSFLAYNFYGLREHGLSYFKQFVGPVLFIAPLFILIEVVSHVFRAVSLGFRLFGNMLGDHIVLGIFLDMTPYLIPIIFYFLGFFVCTLQAFVFTILSMVYVSLAISHDH